MSYYLLEDSQQVSSDIVCHEYLTFSVLILGLLYFFIVTISRYICVKTLISVLKYAW